MEGTLLIEKLMQRNNELEQMLLAALNSESVKEEQFDNLFVSLKANTESPTISVRQSKNAKSEGDFSGLGDLSSIQREKVNRFPRPVASSIPMPISLI
jgi:hypothetical protein